MINKKYLNNVESRHGFKKSSLWRPQSQYSSRRLIQIYGKNLDELIETANNEKSDPIFTEKQIKEHYSTFHISMEKVLGFGRCIGLIPVTNLLDTHPWRVRFQIKSYIFCYSVGIYLMTTTITVFSFYNIFIETFNVRAIAIYIFFLTTSTTALTFMCAASKWPSFVTYIYSSMLAVDSSIIRKCTVIFWVLATLAIVEHLLSIIANVARFLDCFRHEGPHGYMKMIYPFMFALGVPGNFIWIAFTAMTIFISAMHWNFANIFMISMSIYLSSVLRLINKKVELAVQQDMPPHHWRALREAYTRATKLVKLFDDMTSPITFVTFSSSLFFICYRLYFVLTTYLSSNIPTKCPYFPSGPFYGYESIVYFITSLVMIMLRSISFVLSAASVHQASLMTARSLYQVSPDSYCYEVERFIKQVHSSNVALSGYNFFFITRETILTVASAIATYELVLMQYEQNEDVIERLYPVLSVTQIAMNQTQNDL